MSTRTNIFLKFQIQFNAFIIILAFANIISLSYCSTCSLRNSIFDTNCFNDVLKFDNKNYRSGHFATYKNGDMIAEFSDDGTTSTDGYARKFYGLKGNGRYYFSDESPIWEIENIGDIDGNHGRYESLNQIVVTKNDLTRENEFLFSTSSYGSLTELYMFHNKTYTITPTKSFVGETIFSFQYSMIEVEYNNPRKVEMVMSLK